MKINTKYITKITKITAITITSLAIFSLLYVCVTKIEPDQVGIQKNFLNGQITLKESGLYIRPPWKLITKIPTKPIKVTVSTTSKGYNAKLIQFNTNTYKEFILTEGWRYYWWSNRFSYNSGYSKEEEFRGFRDIARGYAYSAIKYPFFITIKEYGQTE